MSDDKVLWTRENLNALDGLNRGDVAPLVALLAGNGPIHPEFRLLLAQVLDPRAETNWQLYFKRRRTRRPTVDIVRRLEVGQSVAILKEKYGNTDAAVCEVMRIMGNKRAYVYDCYADWRHVMDRMAAEETLSEESPEN